MPLAPRDQRIRTGIEEQLGAWDAELTATFARARPVIPSDVTAALGGVTRAFTEALPAVAGSPRDEGPGDEPAAAAAGDTARTAADAADATAPDRVSRLTTGNGRPDGNR